MDLYLEYDEDLSQNQFFRRLQSEHKIILDTAPLENWVICIPRSSTLQEDNLTNPNFLLSHILIPNDELPNTHFTSLLGEDIILINKMLKNKNNIESHILFEEIFYTKSLMKYKVWCIDCPLLPNVNKSSETFGIFIIRDLKDATELLRTETNSIALFRRIDNACRAFVTANSRRLKKLPKLKASTEILYSHCLQNLMMNRRLKEKCRTDIHFYKIIKIALETYMMNEIYGFIFDAITICRIEECEQFNKTMRNLSDAHLSRFNIDSKHNDILTSMRVELLKIEDYTTAIEKLGCLRRALNVASRVKHTNLSMDELIPILVFVIIKSSLNHWITTLTFIQDFIFTDMSDVSEKGADSFLVSTLEAAITYVKTLTNNNERNQNDNRWNDNATCGHDEEYERIKFESKDHFIDYLIEQMCSENEEKVLRLLKTDPNVEIINQINGTGSNSETHFCHPLCDCEICELKCQNGRPTVNTQNQHGIGPLHIASMYGLTTMLNLIIALEANLNIVDESNWTALHYAAARGHQNTLLLLLHAGININAVTNDQSSALHLACLNGHKGCVKALLYYADHMRVKINVNHQNKMGDTPLHLAAKWGFTETVEALLESGSNVETINRLGHTALHYAHNSLISNLLQNSFVVIEKNHSTTSNNNNDDDQCEEIEPFRGYIRDDLMNPNNAGQRKTSTSKIISAIKNGDIQLAYYFLGRQMPPEPENESSHHPLCSCDSCATLLEMTKADPKSKAQFDSGIIDINAPNSDGWTVMHACAEIGDLSLMKFLHQLSASMNAKTYKNETVLHKACDGAGGGTQHFEIIEFILNKCTENLINEQDSNGNTPLHVAVDNGNTKLVNLLMKHDPDIELKNHKNLTVKDIAKNKMFFNIIQILDSISSHSENGNNCVRKINEICIF